MEVIKCNHVADLDLVSRRILTQYPEDRLFGFIGNLGAGKTTLIKNLCVHLGVIDVVNSPSFSIVNEYRTQSGSAVYHMDFYRLRNREELLDIGCDDYFYSGSYCLVEWPEKFEELLPQNFVYIKIDVDAKNNNRLIHLLSAGQV